MGERVNYKSYLLEAKIENDFGTIMHMSPLVIDVREPEEFASGHYEHAINIPPSELMAGENRLKEVAKDTPIILYCRSGSRSNVAIQILKDQGFTNLTNGINKENVKKLLS